MTSAMIPAGVSSSDVAFTPGPAFALGCGIRALGACVMLPT